MITCLYLALAISAISMTTSKSDFFLPLRGWIGRRADAGAWGFGWLDELVRCPYCTSHWLAFGAVAAYQPRLVHSSFALGDYFVTAMAIVALSTMLFGLIWAAIYQMGAK